MIDVATRMVTAAVLRPTTKAVDASVLLARTVTPEPMRPGWAEALAMVRLGAAARAAAGDRRPAGAGRGPAGDRPGHHRGRPREGVRLGRVPVRLPAPGHHRPARPPGQRDRKGHIERHFGVGGLAVLPVRLRLYRPQPGPPRPPRRGPAAVVAGRAAGAAGRVDHRGLAEPAARRAPRPASTRGGRSPRTRSTPRWSRPPATSRSRSARATTSSCCPPSGGPSTPTASR